MTSSTRNEQFTIFNDAPLTGKESSEDQLHRQGFIDTLTKIATSTDNQASLVISLEGAWGEGKTTVLNYLDEKLEKLSSKPIVFRFSPWLIKDTENLIQAYFYQLSARIGLVDNSDAAKSVGAQLLAYSTVFDVLRFIPGAEPWSSIVGKVIKGSGKAVQKISTLKQLDLGQRRESVANALKKLGRRIIILIDDVDRVDADEVFEMLRLIKAVGDLPCVTYVVALDPEYIGNALAEKKIPGREQYLDKIVQVRLSLPRIDDDDLLAILNSTFETMPAAARSEYFEGSSQRLSDLYFHGMRELLETPRDIKRLINRVMTIEYTVRGEVQLADLFGLQILALKAQSIYQHIRERPEAYTGNQPSSGINARTDQQLIAYYANERNLVLNSISERQKRKVEAVVEFLFPLINSGSEPDKSAGALEARGCIASASRLRLALTQEMSSDEFSLIDAKKFIEEPEARRALIFEIGNTKRLLRLLNHLENMQSNKQQPVVNVGYVSILAELVDTPIGREAEDERVGAFTPGSVLYIQRLCLLTIDAMDIEARELAIDQMLQAKQTYTIITWLLDNILDINSTKKGEAGRLRELFKNAEPRQNSWRATLVTKICNGVLNEEVFESANPGYVISALGRLNSTQASELLKSVADQSYLLDQLVVALAGFGSDSDKGRFLYFSPEILATYGGADAIKELMSQSLKSRTPSGIAALAYKSLKTGKRIYTADSSEGDDFGSI